MKNRFTEFNYDKTKWEILKKDTTLESPIGTASKYMKIHDIKHVLTYYLKNLSTNEEHVLFEQFSYVTHKSYDTFLTGIEQIDENVFLVYSYSSTDYQIRRIELNRPFNQSDIYTSHTNLVSLDDDTIWLEYTKVYNIKQNTIIQAPFSFNEITLTISSNGEKFFYCKKCIQYNQNEDYLLFVLDCHTFLPVLPAYSSLRNSFVSLSDEFTARDLIAEDTKYQEYICSYLESITNNSVREAESVLLSTLTERLC